MLSFQAVQAAARRLRAHVIDTPMLPARTLSERYGCELFLKFENLQFTASFKERGALNKLLTMPRTDRARGVLAVSAGNHAQGVAYHAARLGVRACIVMPSATPDVKVQRTREFGAEVVLHGDSFDQARAYGIDLAIRRGLTLIHPYDDPAVIAGQGTIAIEMLRRVRDLDVIVVPVGGGGMIAGIAVAARHLKPGIGIVGVEASAYPAVHAALAGTAPRFRRSTVADGIAVRTPGQLTLPIMRRLVRDVVLVSETAIEQAIVTLLEIEKTVVEGAGAAALAAVARHRAMFAGKRVGLVLSGGNIDTFVLAEILRRVLARTHRLVRLVVRLSDRPGSLAAVSTLLAEAEANIEEVQHQRTFNAAPFKNPEVEFTVQTRGAAHTRAIMRRLDQAGFAVHVAA